LADNKIIPAHKQQILSGVGPVIAEPCNDSMGAAAVQLMH